ncbi:MAG: hypothetical protein L6R35_004308 [Caloplaca aegaea]|nr:MAG: hypothetical protein L6R35_004308 [Caloplaca aegaea]
MASSHQINNDLSFHISDDGMLAITNKETDSTMASSHQINNDLSFHISDDGMLAITNKEGAVVHQMRKCVFGEGDPASWHVEGQPLTMSVRSFTILRHPNALERERGGPFGLKWAEGDKEVVPAVCARRTRQEMETEFERHLEEWERSDAMAALKDAMAIVVKESQIENIVSFGLGSLQTVSKAGRRRSYLQTAALLTVKACINDGRDGKNLAPCFSQDPEYTDLDKEVLRSHGIEPVDDPRGELCDAERELIANMVRGLERIPFPQLQEPEGERVAPFAGVQIYWRKTQEVIGDGQGPAGTEGV